MRICAYAHVSILASYDDSFEFVNTFHMQSTFKSLANLSTALVMALGEWTRRM